MLKCLLHIIFCLCFFFLGCNASHDETKLKNGIINLRGNPSFSKHQEINLNGEWLFFPQEFLNLSEIIEKRESAITLKVPKAWNTQHTKNQFQDHGQGYGTYVIKILLNGDLTKEYALKILTISSAYKIFANEKCLLSVGQVGKNKQEEIPEYNPLILDIYTNTNELYLIFHVSNFHHARGGIWDNIIFGEKTTIKKNKDLNNIKESFIIGAMLILGFYHLGMYFLLRSHGPTLYFSLFTLSFGLRTLFTGEMTIGLLTSNLDFDTRLKIEYISLAISSLTGMLYFQSTYKEYFSNKATKTIVSLQAGYILFVLSTEALVFSKYLSILQALVIVIVVYNIICLIQVLKSRKDESYIIFLGIFIWAGTIINDMLVYLEIYNFIKLTTMGIFIFLLIQAYQLSKHFHSAILESNQLTNKLSDTHNAYNRFVPREFLDFLGKNNVTDISVGDVIQIEGTVLLCDIRSFTALTERSNPKELFNFLNEYFESMNQIIIKHNGIIDKYMGDAILAIFPNRCEDALNCAIEMQRTLKEHKFSLDGKELLIEAGVALHHGDLLLGVIGGQKLIQTTVISDTVNTCSRLQSLTKTYGTNIIISETILHNLEEVIRYHFRFLDHAIVPGKEDTIYICEVYDYESPEQISLKMETKNFFDKGVLIYQSGEYEESWKIFIEILKKNPQDGPSLFYLNRAATFLVKGITLIHEYDDKLVEWETSWETGIKMIDDQHKLLFDIMNDLHKAIKFKRGQEVLNRILNNLNLYVLTHFTMEEELMLRYKYPDFENHKKQHTLFINKLENALDRYNHSSINSSNEILEFLKDWLIAHIKKSDKEGYVPYIEQAEKQTV
jgi:adenylate cyclase